MIMANKRPNPDFWGKALVAFTGASSMALLLSAEYGLLDKAYYQAALGTYIAMVGAGNALYSFIYGGENDASGNRAPINARTDSEE